MQFYPGPIVKPSTNYARNFNDSFSVNGIHLPGAAFLLLSLFFVSFLLAIFVSRQQNTPWKLRIISII